MKHIVLMASIAALPVLSACSLLPNDPVPANPALTGMAAQNAAWRNDIQPARHGGLPSFKPLDKAEKAVAQAKAQPRTEQFDAHSLEQAEQALSQAKTDWQRVGKQKKPSDDDLAKVADEAHRARRLAQIAQYTAQRDTGAAQLQDANQQLTAQEHRQNAVGQDLNGRKVVPDMLGQIEFDTGTARLTDASHNIVDRLAKLLEAHPKSGVVIFGFTDNGAPSDAHRQAFMQANPSLKDKAKTVEQQNQAYNQALSTARARDVAQLLVQDGIDPHRIGARGFGSQHPIASNDTEAGRRKNQRVEAVIVPLKRQGQ